MAPTLVFGSRIAGGEAGVHRLLMTVIVGQRGMDVRQRQVGRRLDDLCHTVAMRHVIGDEVEDPMAGAVEAWGPAGIESVF